MTPSPAPAAPRTLPLATAALLAATAALVTATALRLPGAWASGNGLNHVSGAWLALAEDLAHGTFYRPLVDADLGTGGTRFFPLVFALHAGLRSAGADLFASGYLLSLLAGLAVVAGVYALARGAGRAPPLAAAFGALAFAAVASQQALASARGDLLPVGLSALGLAALLRVPGARRQALVLLGGTAIFALAFAAKPTALTAPAAGAVWLWLRGERRAAVALGASVGVAAGGIVLATDALAGGRFLALLAACASGGAVPLDLVRGPVRLLGEMLHEDRAALLLVGGGAAAGLAALPGHLREARASAVGPGALPVLWLGAALAGAVVVFASPGTGANHLVESEAAAAASLAAAWGAAGRVRLLARAFAPIVAVAGFAVALQLHVLDGTTSRRLELAEVSAALPPGPILSEDPLLPLSRGERPALLDPWMLRLAAERDPRVAGPLAARVRAGAFEAIVLYGDLEDPAARAWYEREHLGPALVAAIREAYRPWERRGRYLVYLRAAPAAPSLPSVVVTGKR